MRRIYFDNAATTPIAPEVVDIMMDALRKLYGNPSSIHADGRNARAAVEEARKIVAKCLNASIGEIFFTSGGTESNNMILKNAVRDLGVQRIVTTAIEHHCVLHTAEYLAKTQNIELVFVKIDANGVVDLDNLSEILRGSDKKTIVSLMHANNEIGTMIDLEKVGNICAENGAYFHSDTVQTMGYFPIDLSALKIHFLTGAAHKFHGPKGTGFLYINGDLALKPFIDGVRRSAICGAAQRM
jgi:cysteine desulfurase